MKRSYNYPSPRRGIQKSSSKIFTTTEKKNVKQSGWKGFRLWTCLLVGTVIFCERALVFAAPRPLTYSSSNTTTSNKVIPRNNIISNTNFIKEQLSTIKTQNQQLSTTTREEQNDTINKSDANLAFFVQISPNTIHHLPRLLNRIYHEKNVYAIHLDLKILEKERQKITNNIYSNLKYKNNVHVMDSELIIYRGVSMLLNTINAMRLLLDKDYTWDYFINISGSDYPLLDVQSQRRLLGLNKGLNFFTFADSTGWEQMAHHRLRQMWYDESLTFRKNAKSGQLTNLQVKNPLLDDKDFIIAHSEAWLLSSRQFCDFVVRGDMARKMLLSFAYSADSSEHYFSSLALNHPQFKKTIVTHAMRHVVWLHQGKSSGQHPYNVDEKLSDGSYKFKHLLENSVLFFSRKFENVDSPLMDFLDKRAKDPQVIAAAEDHLVKKIAARQQRINEL